MKTRIVFKHERNIFLDRISTPEILLRDVTEIFRHYFKDGAKEVPSPQRSRRKRIVHEYIKEKAKEFASMYTTCQGSSHVNASMSFDTVRVVMIGKNYGDEITVAWLDPDEVSEMVIHKDLSELTVKHLDGVHVLGRVTILTEVSPNMVKEVAIVMNQVGNLLISNGKVKREFWGLGEYVSWRVDCWDARADHGPMAKLIIAPTSNASPEVHRKLPHLASAVQAVIEAELS